MWGAAKGKICSLSKKKIKKEKGGGHETNTEAKKKWYKIFSLITHLRGTHVVRARTSS